MKKIIILLCIFFATTSFYAQLKRDSINSEISAGEIVENEIDTDSTGVQETEEAPLEPDKKDINTERFETRNDISINESKGIDYDLFSILFVASLIVNLLFVLKSKNTVKTEVTRNEVPKNWDLEMSGQSKTIKTLEEKIIKLEGYIDMLENDLEMERGKDPTLNTTIPIPSIDNEDDASEPIELDLGNNNFKVFYLPSPFDENRFSKEDSKEVPTPTSLYVIDYDRIKNKGEFSLIEGANFDRAINSPYDYFEKVCIYDNPPDVNATRVVVTLKGEVELDGDDWLVTKKLRIKFS